MQSDADEMGAMQDARDRLAAYAIDRRSLLKKGGLLAAGATAVSWKLFDVVKVQAAGPGDSAQDILNLAVTAERLAVTFYSHGVINRERLELEGEDLDYIKAALIEEQIHEQFFVGAGGKTLNPGNTYSFPQGQRTFEHLETFIDTQQQLEGVFDAAFISACRRFAQLDSSGKLSQIACQIAMIESEHRALGRAILKRRPADNWVYGDSQGLTDPFVQTAVATVAKAGYLSPTAGNSFTYEPVFPVGTALKNELASVNERIVSRTP
ncbi:MAG: ferritin-like domain-containing protein [Candidatus Dormibacteraeota bacterium]|nr:ferritin-like domain-containing protein [Candidatus Dormibacteraeota bacterium]